jgi:hypothetical protein
MVVLKLQNAFGSNRLGRNASPNGAKRLWLSVAAAAHVLALELPWLSAAATAHVLALELPWLSVAAAAHVLALELQLNPLAGVETDC